jgi:DNA repair photolyase
MKSKTGTAEWSDRTVNIQLGCEYGCRYCYACAMAIRFGRIRPGCWKIPQAGKPARVIRRKRPGVTMFPSTHDITRSNAGACADAIQAILDGGDNALVVTKGDPEAVKFALGRFSPRREAMAADRIEVRVTIGSASDQVLHYWEPGAPAFRKRIETLEWLRQSGFATSVSMEPMLDADPLAVVRAADKFATRGIWFGTARMLRARVAMNCPGDTKAFIKAGLLEGAWCDLAVIGFVDLVRRVLPRHRIHFKDSIRESLKRSGFQVG